MKISDLTIRSRLFAGNIITAVILITLCAIAWVSIQTLTQTERMVEHTHKVIKESNGLVNSMVDQETGLRGFAIGGQEEYLEPYFSGKERLILFYPRLSSSPVITQPSKNDLMI